MFTLPPKRLAPIALGLALTLGSSTLTSTALAQEGANKAAAEALFNQGKKAFDAKDYAKACKKFDASHKLEPAVGTLLFLGECNERQGKTASAWGAFKEASSLASRTNDEKRKAIADVRVAALEPQVSKLTVVIAEPVEGLSIRRDGVELPEGSWGAALPIDAGEHQVDASAPGRKSWSSTVSVDDGGETYTVNVPTLAAVGGGAPLPAPSGDGSTPMVPPSGGDEGASGSSLGTALEITGLTVAGLGGVGIIVGSVFGVMAMGSNDDSLAACRTEEFCTPEGVALRDDAKSQALVSTVTFIVGGALVAGGLTLFFLAPDDDDTTDVGHLALDASVGPGQAGLTLHGSW